MVSDAEDAYICPTCGTPEDDLQEHDCVDELVRRRNDLMRGITTEAPLESLADDALWALLSSLKQTYESHRSVTQERSSEVKRAEQRRDRAYSAQQDTRRKLVQVRDHMNERLGLVGDD